MVTSDKRDTPRAALAAAAVAIAIAAAIVCSDVFGQERVSYSDRSVVIFTADFPCEHCDVAAAYARGLQQTHPGLHVDVFVTSKSKAQALGITGFPTTIVGKRLTGFGPLERDVIRAEVER